MRVKNLNRSALGKSGSGSWLTHWEKLSAQNAWMCYVQGCIGRPTAGGCVQKDSPTDRSWYVVPLCASCNEKSGQDLDIWDDARLISATESASKALPIARRRNLSPWACKPALV